MEAIEVPKMTQMDYLRTYRKAMNLNQVDVARVLGCARTTIVALEQGIVNLSQIRYQKLRAMGFPEVEFVAEEPLPIPETGWQLLNSLETDLITAVRTNDYRESMRLILAMTEVEND